MTALNNSIIWLTGASSGIGESLANELAQRGARVAVTARNAEKLEQLASNARAKGQFLQPFPGDVQDLAQMKVIAHQIEQSLGPIDILIANAGTHRFTVPEKFDSQEYLSLMDLNYGGILRCIEAVLPAMLERKKGAIVGMASLAGYRGLPRAGAYSASKAATIRFLESLRFHLDRHGLSVTIVNPGFVKTPLTDKNDFPMPFLTTADKAARIIADGIERNKKEITFPFPFNWLLKLTRIIPYPVYEKIAERLW